MIIFSYIYTNSIYEIHGLNNIGDSSLNEYQVDYKSGEDLLKVYKGLIEEKAEFQVVKTLFQMMEIPIMIFTIQI